MPLTPKMSQGMFSCCPSTVFTCLFVYLSVHSSGQILLPRYLMNGLSNLEETDWEYSLAPADDLIRLVRGQRSRSQQAAEVVKASMSMLGHHILSSSSLGTFIVVSHCLSYIQHLNTVD